VHTLHLGYHGVCRCLLLLCSILAGIDAALPALEQQQQQRDQRVDQDLQQHCSRTTGNTISSSSSSSSGGYVCVLDDDVALHPLSLCQLVDEMQADPQLFMATGRCNVSKREVLKVQP
jgi:membrane glycosyltransferase